MKLRNLILLIALSCTPVGLHMSAAQASIPMGWQKFKAQQYFTFYMPKSMRLRSEERCLECAWGSSFRNSRIMLFAEYTSWNEEYTSQYLEKQKDYVKELVQIDGHNAKIQSWLGERQVLGLSYVAEVRFYESNGTLRARMSARCKTLRDVETAKQIFRTVDFPD